MSYQIRWRIWIRVDGENESYRLIDLSVRPWDQSLLSHYLNRIAYSDNIIIGNIKGNMAVFGFMNNDQTVVSEK
jgi:hypothetical protein